MEIFFVDDSAQAGHRGGMGELVAGGGLLLAEESLRPLKDKVDDLCKKFGVPPGTELKWSPGKKNWLRDHLKAERRCELFGNAIAAARELGGRAIVVVWDTGRKTYKGSKTFRTVIDYLFERVTIHLEDRGHLGLIVADRPGGGKREEDSLLRDVVGTMEDGTEYVKSTQIALNLLTTPSHLSRHLQVADLITGCTTAMVAGQTAFCDPVFAEVRPMFIENYYGCVGGSGLKLVPDDLINLYFYVLKETAFIKARSGGGISLPWRDLPYYYDGNDPAKRIDARGDRVDPSASAAQAKASA
jgi:hypothetical protein